MKRLLEGLWDLAAFLDWDHNCVVDFEDEKLPLNRPSIPLVNFNLVGGHFSPLRVSLSGTLQSYQCGPTDTTYRVFLEGKEEVVYILCSSESVHTLAFTCSLRNIQIMQRT